MARKKPSACKYSFRILFFIHFRVYTLKKKVREFPVLSRDVTTKLSLGGNNDVITELFLPRWSLVSDMPAGDGKLVNIFYGVGASFCKKGLTRFTLHTLLRSDGNF
jgi:hypothetical protein